MPDDEAKNKPASDEQLYMLRNLATETLRGTYKAFVGYSEAQSPDPNAVAAFVHSALQIGVELAIASGLSPTDVSQMVLDVGIRFAPKVSAERQRQRDELN